MILQLSDQTITTGHRTGMDRILKNKERFPLIDDAVEIQTRTNDHRTPMERIKDRMARHREIADNYAEEDERVSAIWSARLCGKRIVTDDLERAQESRTAASKIGVGDIVGRGARIFCNSPKFIGPITYQAQHSSRLFSLPTEIRLQILEEALVPTGPSGLQLIFACKQLYVEGRNIALQNHVVHEYDLPSCVKLQSPRLCRDPCIAFRWRLSTFYPLTCFLLPVHSLYIYFNSKWVIEKVVMSNTWTQRLQSHFMPKPVVESDEE